jgi:hypothetical protein
MHFSSKNRWWLTGGYLKKKFKNLRTVGMYWNQFFGVFFLEGGGGKPWVMNPKNRPDICQGSIPKTSLVGHLSGFY